MNKKFAVVINVTEEGKEQQSGYMKLESGSITGQWSTEICYGPFKDPYLRVFDSIKKNIKSKTVRTYLDYAYVPYILSFLFPNSYMRSPGSNHGKVELILFSFEGTLLDLKTERIAELSFYVKEYPFDSKKPPEMEFLGEILHNTDTQHLECGNYLHGTSL